MDIEQIAMVAMEIIAYAGTAKSHCILALQAAKAGNFDEAEKNLMEAEKNFQQAHHNHKDLLDREMDLKEPQVSMLLIHAEDQLMSVETIRFVVMEFIDLIKERELISRGNL